MFILRKIYSVRRNFCLKVSTFPNLLVVSVSLALSHLLAYLLWPNGSHVTSKA